MIEADPAIVVACGLILLNMIVTVVVVNWAVRIIEQNFKLDRAIEMERRNHDASLPTVKPQRPAPRGRAWESRREGPPPQPPPHAVARDYRR